MYMEGITHIPRPLDKDTVNKNYELEQTQRALERQVRKAKRLEEGVLDEEKKMEYTAKRKLAQKQLREFIAEHDDVLRRDLWREKVFPGLEKDRAQKLVDRIIEYDEDKAVKYFRPESIERELSRSAVGRFYEQYIDENRIHVHIDYDYEPEDMAGETTDGEIYVYAKKHKYLYQIVETIIHEAAHIESRYYGDLHAEAYCKAQEAKHRTPFLTYSDLRVIIEETRKLYPYYKWRKRR